MRKRYSFQVNGKDYLLGQRTWFMGVLNITPDSFSDGGRYFDKDKALERGLELAADGADIIDVGGESTRPGSDPVPVQEELRRVIPVVSSLKEKTDVLISVDTTKSEVAEAAIEAGADIINDISAFRLDSKMPLLAAQKGISVILMHMKGTPKTMQINPYYEDLLSEIKSFLQEKIQFAQASGINKEKIIIDPGIGFGKSAADNLILINHLNFLEELECPILIGTSRKSFLGKILNLPPQERSEGSIASAVMGVIRGAHILRVHDVRSVKRAVLVAESILNEKIVVNAQGEKKEEHVC
ncbi:MAG: dihydropteroate synthase [Candidatus Aminicenantes bacterium]|nr:dihydropteroate synthase [Candidatus Aminicenantes bacterium]